MDKINSVVHVCANCQGPAKSACSSCRLVVYCGPKCQKKHWATHKSVCKSPLIKASWQPAWVTEKRTPAFINDGPPQVKFGRQKYLWGNMPAFDVFQLQDNEGEVYEKPLRVLFAASGDLRNVVKSVAELPQNHSSKLSVVINDRDFDIVARNAIILLIALVNEDEDEAVGCILHLWYSALITPKHWEFLTSRIYPMIEDVYQKVKDKSAQVDLAKTFSFGTRSLRLTLKKAEWKALLSFLSSPPDLTAEQAQKIRRATTLAPERVDYRDRNMLAQSAVGRICENHFRQDGILLQFSCSRKEYTVPNPTFYQTKQWPMMDNANPLDSWSMPEILKTDAGPATNDMFGKLFCHIQSVLRSFYRRIANSDLEFQLFNLDARELQGYTKEQEFGRIEVSNISDGGYLGIAQTVELFAPMLQTPTDNSHATLITLFLNAVDEVRGKDDISAVASELGRVIQYMGYHKLSGMNDPKTITMSAAKNCVRDGDVFFTKYMAWHRFSNVERSYGVKAKEPHTIIAKWPLRLKLRPGENGAKEEFELLLSSGHEGTERYVEWRRTE